MGVQMAASAAPVQAEASTNAPLRGKFVSASNNFLNAPFAPNKTELATAAPTTREETPRYKAKKPSCLMVERKSWTAFICATPATATVALAACMRTLMVSSGWPTAASATPGDARVRGEWR